MEKLKRCLKFIKSGSCEKLFLTVMRTLWYNIKLRIWSVRDQHRNVRDYVKAAQGIKAVNITMGDLDLSAISKQVAGELWKMYQQHRFDLLGSGWVKSDFKSQAAGINGYRYESLKLETDTEGNFLNQILRKHHFERAKEIYSQISSDYEPIDWQKDFKSGYRWGADRWYRPQEIARKPGGDIKVPWELSRLQHLPRLAILSEALPDKREHIYQEFRNQVLDFIAQNPVCMGVNHMCTMDVGIRVANISLACSLWKGAGRQFDSVFEKIVTNYLFQECDFIRKNLEWSYYLTSNHYFANIAGLLWGSAVLPECVQRKKWIVFAKEQLVNEIRKQFHREGSNGEGSTAYHRLTGEMALYSVALIHYLAKTEGMRDVEADIYGLLYRAGRFTRDIQRPDGSFTQIGDNDSGLFFRLSVTGGIGKEGYLDENMNDGRTFVSATAGMFQTSEPDRAVVEYPLEYSLVHALMCGERIPCDEKRELGRVTVCSAPLSYIKTYEIHGNAAKSLRKGLIRLDYAEFGLYIFRSDEVYLCLNVSDNGQRGNAGHAHNDKLSFELFIGGKCFFEDPGTYVYTPFPELRNQYRGTRYHNTVYCGEEQNRFNGLFSMYNDTQCFISILGQDIIEAQTEYRGIVHRRKIEILDDMVRVTDSCNREFEQQFINRRIARGYGKLER